MSWQNSWDPFPTFVIKCLTKYLESGAEGAITWFSTYLETLYYINLWLL